MNNLAAGYRAAGKLDLALPLFEQTLKLKEAQLGPADPGTLRSMFSLASAYEAAGKLDLALPLYEETLKLRKAKLGPENPETLRSMSYLALAYEAAGKLDLALPLYEQMLKLSNATLGPEHPQQVTYMEYQAIMYLEVAARQAWFSQERDFADTCRRALEFAAGTKDPLIADRIAKTCSLMSLAEQAQRDAALVLARSAVQLGEKHPLLPYFQMAQGMAEYRCGHFVDADAVLAAATTKGKGDAYTQMTGALYRAMSLFRQGKREEARQLATAAAATMKPLPKDEPNLLAEKAKHDDLILWLAYKEAKKLIGFDAPPSAVPRDGASWAPEKK
jgi:tetratricopeptide (TPR) repeat protein